MPPSRTSSMPVGRAARNSVTRSGRRLGCARCYSLKRMGVGTDNVSEWRFPKRTIVVLIALYLAGAIGILVVDAPLELSPTGIRVLWLAVTFGGIVNALYLTGLAIRMDPNEVLWCLGPMEMTLLLREDVERYQVVRQLGLDWLHIERKTGFAYRWPLAFPGDGGFGQQLLQWLKPGERQ